MRVLFISSGNSLNGITSIVKNQAQSLVETSIEVQYFSIIGKGLTGYLKNIKKLKAYLKSADIDLIHAHYSLSAILASLTFTKKPVVVSLMGSDIKSALYWKIIIKLFNLLFWDQLIVKSAQMQKDLRILNTKVIPNGVDFKFFFPKDKTESLNRLNWDPDKKHFLFAASSERKEKNFQLAKESVAKINSVNIELHTLENIYFDEMPYFYSAADVILLTSLWEGSPNVIKEAMACNRPIVATNVGDIQWLIEDVDGCFITSFDPKQTAIQIEKALEFKATEGRKKLIDLGLGSESIAKKIISLYYQVLNK